MLPALGWLLVLAPGPLDPPSAWAASSSIRPAFASGERTSEQRALDERFRPDLLLEYARVHRGMRVGQWLPADAYYLEAAAHVLGEHGRVFAVAPEETVGKGVAAAAAAGTPASTGAPEARSGRAAIEVAREPEAGSLHAAFLLYDVHQLTARDETFDALHRQILEALRPGGYYVVVDAAAAPGMEATEARALGRSHASAVEAKLQALGFERSGEARFLANPLDERDGAAVDAASRGRADRFVLRFRKPLPSLRPAMSTGW